jgi:TRAP-type uncharacterized transport system fused permease subunit
MLELVQPQVTFITVMKAAVIPALLYYFSILALVFLYSRRLGAEGLDAQQIANKKLSGFEATVFAGALGTLIGLLILGFSPFRSVTGSLAVILVFATLRSELPISPRARKMAFASFLLVMLLHQLIIPAADYAPSFLRPFLASSWIDARTGSISPMLMVGSLLESAILGMFGLLTFGLLNPIWRPHLIHEFVKSAKNGVALVAASACVGIIIGVVQQTGIASDFSSVIKGVVETNLFLALVGIMVCSLILGMGVPSVVCYLLMATLMGSLLGELGVLPLVAHLFIFYFGMMSMVTPPVALAGYAAASIAEAPIMRTSFAAFRFSLVGFTLPYMFVYRPALCLLAPEGSELTWWAIFHAVAAATIGIMALASALAGFISRPMGLVQRVLMYISAAMLLAPITTIGDMNVGILVDVTGALLFAAVVVANLYSGTESHPGNPGHSQTVPT